MVCLSRHNELQLPPTEDSPVFRRKMGSREVAWFEPAMAKLLEEPLYHRQSECEACIRSLLSHQLVAHRRYLRCHHYRHCHHFHRCHHHLRRIHMSFYSIFSYNLSTSGNILHASTSYSLRSHPHTLKFIWEKLFLLSPPFFSQFGCKDDIFNLEWNIWE